MSGNLGYYINCQTVIFWSRDQIFLSRLTNFHIANKETLIHVLQDREDSGVILKGIQRPTLTERGS